MGCTASSFEAKKRLVGRHRPVPTTLSRKKLLSHRDDMKISVSSRPSDCAAPRYSLEEIIKGNRESEIKIETSTVGIAIIISANNCDLMKVVTPQDNNNKPINVVNDDDEKEKESPKLGKKDVKFVDTEHEDDDDNDDEDDERRIGFEEGEASPSFRVYFQENTEYSLNQETVKYGDDDALTDKISTGDIVSSKEVMTCHDDVENKVKRDRKKRCFRKVLVLPKKGSQADMKRILNMKSCYST